MEKEKLKNIVADTAGESELRKFDDLLSKAAIEDPSEKFTSRVMATLPGDGFKVGFHFWGIILGVVLVFVLWAMEGFVTPEIKLSYQLPEGLKVVDVGTIELTQMTQAFMMINAMLLLLLIDRIFQRKKRRVV